MKQKMINIVIAGALLALTAGMMGLGLWPVNNPPYRVKGVDVSHYQGDIDWGTLAGQGLSFAFIKATEGSTSVDERFAANLDAARQAGLRTGAYHFFSYDSPGASQAEHFIDIVPKFPDMLPPVIDVEFYGDYNRHPADAERVLPELRDMVERLLAYYGRPPILYATGKSYQLYIKDRFDDCGLWIRNVFGVPDEDWLFWQYTDRARLKGYVGETAYIDMNVFSGDMAGLEALAEEGHSEQEG